MSITIHATPPLTLHRKKSTCSHTIIYEGEDGSRDGSEPVVLSVQVLSAPRKTLLYKYSLSLSNGIIGEGSWVSKGKNPRPGSVHEIPDDCRIRMVDGDDAEYKVVRGGGGGVHRREQTSDVRDVKVQYNVNSARRRRRSGSYKKNKTSCQKEEDPWANQGRGEGNLLSNRKRLDNNDDGHSCQVQHCGNSWSSEDVVKGAEDYMEYKASLLSGRNEDGMHDPQLDSLKKEMNWICPPDDRLAKDFAEAMKRLRGVKEETLNIARSCEECAIESGSSAGNKNKPFKTFKTLEAVEGRVRERRLEKEKKEIQEREREIKEESNDQTMIDKRGNFYTVRIPRTARRVDVNGREYTVYLLIVCDAPHGDDGGGILQVEKRYSQFYALSKVIREALPGRRVKDEEKRRELLEEWIKAVIDRVEVLEWIGVHREEREQLLNK